MTASSRPMVAASVGEITNGRSGTSEDCMVNLGNYSRLEQFDLRGLHRHCRASREAAVMLPQPRPIPAGNPLELPTGSLRDIQLQFHADPTVCHRALGDDTSQLCTTSECGINRCKLFQNGGGAGLPEGLQILR